MKRWVLQNAFRRLFPGTVNMFLLNLTRTWKRSSFIKQHHSHLAIKLTLNHFKCPSFRMISTGCQQTRWNHIIYRYTYHTSHCFISPSIHHFNLRIPTFCHLYAFAAMAPLRRPTATENPRNSSANCRDSAACWFNGRSKWIHSEKTNGSL